MAANNVVGVITADHPVTLKIIVEGVTRRAKMSLRDMTPSALEGKVRDFLHIPDQVAITIERFSDSAAAYVTLEATNTPVYKQLYRAAKAKSKLKLRVTLVDQVADALKTETPDQEKVEQTTTAAPSLPKRTKISVSDLTEQLAALPPLSPPAPAQPTPNPTIDPSVLLKTAAGAHGGWYKNADGQSAYTLFNTFHTTPAPPHVDASSVQPPSASPSSGCTRDREFAVCCNACDSPIPNTHYHCGTCDDGDFDLCENCVKGGASCHNESHWMIKRTLVDGVFIHSTSHILTSKPKSPDAPKVPNVYSNASPRRHATRSSDSSLPLPQTKSSAYSGLEWYTRADGSVNWTQVEQIKDFAEFKDPVPSSDNAPRSGRFAPAISVMRTCNSCIEERPEVDFLHCRDCEDYDLCQSCFQRGQHGHHPKHVFLAAVPGTKVRDHINVKLAAGRNQSHNAICDGCDKYITGVRHKCLDCPDWDYCGTCVPNASFVHANHRFVPIYEPLRDLCRVAAQPTHIGICCDGPLCSISKSSYIRGIRYKCAICHDVDFCANCEAHPSTEHNKTHPLIKFKTPVRHATVSTSGEHGNGQPMRPMGDRSCTRSQATETAAPAPTSSINKVQTVVDVKPAEAADPVAQKEKAAVPDAEKMCTTKNAGATADEQNLNAVFVKDTIVDGTILPPNDTFTQTWVLENKGAVAWPAGCAVRFVGGDYMGRVDSAHPAPVAELESAAESTACEAQVLPGKMFAFTVSLRTPSRPGRFISYWRLTAPSGFKFGHRLWCDVNVRAVEAPKPAEAQPEAVEPKKEESAKQDTMIFPKLETESPESSMYEEAPTETATEAKGAETEEFEEHDDEDAEWDISEDDQGFMTDEEYDILDASDEEFLEKQGKETSD